MLMNRIVTGPKLFTSTTANRVLAVLNVNTDPVYTQVINEMIANRAIDGSKLFTSSAANMMLAVKTVNSDPVWSKIDNSFMENNSITTNNLVDLIITTPKIANESVTVEKLNPTPLIKSINIFDNAVINSKIEDGAISTTKIADLSITTQKIVDKAITSSKLESNLILDGHPTVPAHTDYTTRSLRNTIISPIAPTNDQGSNGDIWIQYI
jgi:hypothetical protein